MIGGIEKFREFFAAYQNEYVLIGGAACDLLFAENAMSFRATKDLDIVLIAEALTPDFGNVFWNFVKEGQYQIAQRSDGKPLFYRFQKPQKPGFPYMLELFSRKENILDKSGGSIPFTRLSLGENLSSLSAILLNDTYYELIKQGTIQIAGISILSEEFLILFKVKAWLDLTKRRKLGEQVDSKDIKKHKNDVIRLATLLSPNVRVNLNEDVKNDMLAFIDAYKESPADFKSLHINYVEKEDIIDRISQCYGLE